MNEAPSANAGAGAGAGAGGAGAADHSAKTMAEDQAANALLHKQLLAAHEAQDAAALTELYTAAADIEQSHGEISAMCYFLTQAYVHALQSGHPCCEQLHARLAEHGRI